MQSITINVSCGVQIDPGESGQAENWQRSQLHATIGGCELAVTWSELRQRFELTSSWSEPQPFPSFVTAHEAFLSALRARVGSVADQLVAGQIPAARADADRRRQEAESEAARLRAEEDEQRRLEALAAQAEADRA